MLRAVRTRRRPGRRRHRRRCVLATAIVDETVTAAPASTRPAHRRAVIPRSPVGGASGSAVGASSSTLTIDGHGDLDASFDGDAATGHGIVVDRGRHRSEVVAVEAPHVVVDAGDDGDLARLVRDHDDLLRDRVELGRGSRTAASRPVRCSRDSVRPNQAWVTSPVSSGQLDVCVAIVRRSRSGAPSSSTCTKSPLGTVQSSRHTPSAMS